MMKDFHHTSENTSDTMTAGDHSTQAFTPRSVSTTANTTATTAATTSSMLLLVSSSCTNKMAQNYDSSADNTNDNDGDQAVTYFRLLSENAQFRYYWFSYVANHIGEWMTYMASIACIHQDTNTAKNTAISILVIVKLLPNVFCLPIGGALADKYDRRMSMIAIDLISSLLFLLFWMSVYSQSILILYLANFVQELLNGLYLPSNSSILPMLVSSDQELQKATTLSGMSWSLMVAVGSAAGGIFVTLFGVYGCFFIDAVTYVISALLLYAIPGNYNVADQSVKEIPPKMVIQDVNETSFLIKNRIFSSSESRSLSQPNSSSSHDIDNPLASSPSIHSSSFSSIHATDLSQNERHSESEGASISMILEGIKYAFNEPTVGAFSLLKGTTALVYGSTDVLNVAFSERGSPDPKTASLRVGFLFLCVGIGCILGSLLGDHYSAVNHPRRMLLLCLTGLAVESIGCIFVGYFSLFPIVAITAILRSSGSAFVWVGSTLLIQKLARPEMLGRVQSIDFSFALLAEALSALTTGVLMDDAKWSPEFSCIIIGFIGLATLMFWILFEYCVGATGAPGKGQTTNS